MRLATLLLVVLAACNDVRDFAGPWRGARVGASPVLKVGIADGAIAELAIDEIDTHGLRGRLTVDTGQDYLVFDAPVTSVEGAEADALATVTFTGSPLRVYLAFVAVTDGQGDALAVIALYDSDRIDVRLLRGGPAPIYAIFALSERT